jgi:hypothetical protein
MAEINYGESDAQRAAKAAEAFTQSSAQGITELEQKYKESVNTLAQGIVTGITPTEKSVLEKSVADLGNRYSQAIAATQGQFAFAQEQATKTSAAMAEQYAQMQDAQRALASQTLGAAGVQLQPGRQTAAQRDALAQAQQIGASNLAFIGGAGAVPEQLLAPEQRQAIGMTGVAGLARDLYNQSLEGQKAASRAQLEGSRVNLQTALEARALQTAADREQKERDRLREFEMTGLNAIIAAKASNDAKLAEYLAAAASADTRSGKEKALADYEMFKKQEDTKLQNDLRRIGAQAKASGSTQVSQAADDLTAEITGRSSAFGKNLALAISRRPQGRPTGTSFNIGGTKVDLSLAGKTYTIDQLWDANKLPSAFAVPGVAGLFYMSGNNVVHEIKDNNIPVAQYYPLENLNKQLNTLAGYLQKQKVSKEQSYAYANNVIGGLSDQDRLALRYLLGTADPGAIAGILSAGSRSTTTNTASTKPASTKPVFPTAASKVVYVPGQKPTSKK